MKTIYSLKEFYEETIKLAKEVGQSYVNVGVSYNTHEGIQFKCYINKYNYQTGKTMEESLKKQRDDIFPPSSENIDVEIDIEPEDIDLGKKAIEELTAFHAEK